MIKEVVFSPIHWNGTPPSDFKFQVSKELTMSFSGSHISYATNESNGKFVLKQATKPEKTIHEWEGLQKLSEYPLPIQEPVGLANDQNGQLTLISKEVVGKPVYQTEQGRVLLGKSIRELHHIVQVDNNFWITSGKPNFTFYNSAIDRWHGENIPELQKTGKIVSLIYNLSSEISEHLQTVRPSFLHNDVHDGQGFIVNNNCVLIDFEQWGISDPIEDIALYLYHQIRIGKEDVHFEQFIQGYIPDGKLTDKEKNATAFYLLYFASRAAAFFYLKRLDYYQIGLGNLLKSVKYIESEKLWKF